MNKMQKMKKWIGRRIGSTESLNKITSSGAPYQPHHLHVKTEYELISIKIKQLLERKSYQKVVEILREQPYVFVLKCLESFPFKTLNKAVPEAFPIWETLLTKLHNSEEGYIREFPYNACDELVLRIAWLVETRDEKSPEGQELVVSCRRVLKCVYMQYNGVLEHLYKEHDRVQHSLYALGLHLPLGTDVRTAQSLQQAIRNEVTGCVVDFNDAKDRLQEISEKEELSLDEMLLQDRKVDVPSGSDEDSGDGDDGGITMRFTDFPRAPNPNQVQLQERLYQNQCVLTCLQPSRRTGTLPELMELLNERIRGDKEVLAVFGRVRQRNGGITDCEPIEPWLRRHQHSIECTIGMIKEIEKELEIKIIKSESPAQLQWKHREVNGVSDEDPQIIPANRPRSRSHEHSPLLTRRHSAAIAEQYPWEEDTDMQNGLSERTDKNRLSVGLLGHGRPRSASPNKIYRANGGPPIRSPSSKSMSSSNGSTNDLIAAVQSSSSIGDLNSTNKDPPLAFTRVQSLKSNHSVQVVAGKRKQSSSKSRNSWTNLSGSRSVGNVSNKKQKSLFRSGSGGIGPWERQFSGDSQHMGHYTLLHQDLEAKTKELLVAKEQIYELRRRERELTDRLSDQAQRHLQDSEKFEDILLGQNRPTVVVQRYQELYSQGRVDAVEGINGIQSGGMEESAGEQRNKAFAIRLVLDALEFSYAVSCSHLEQLRQDWRSILGVCESSEDSVAVKHLESAIGLYLRRVCSFKDITDIAKKVEELLEDKYEAHPIFTQALDLDTVKSYVIECSKVCWDLCVQTPPMLIDSHETLFNFDHHVRFFDSDKESCDILHYHWPTLLQTSHTGAIVLSKGWVQT